MFCEKAGDRADDGVVVIVVATSETCFKLSVGTTVLSALGVGTTVLSDLGVGTTVLLDLVATLIGRVVGK